LNDNVHGGFLMTRRCVWIVVLVAAAMAVTVSCGPNTNYIRRMQALEEGVDSPTSIEELEEAIKKYQNRIEDVLNADIRIGMWYKILATRYLDNKMYGKALDTFRTAIEYYPTNQNLYYYVGVCAGYMAKSALDFEASGSRAERDRYLALAESAYLRAIELEPRYIRALYGLSILYIFELDMPEKAIPHLEIVTGNESRDADSRFMLARAYYATGRLEDAVSVYDDILRISKDEKTRASATENKARVLEEFHGQQ